MPSKQTVAKLAIELVGDDAQLRKVLDRTQKEGETWGATIAQAGAMAAAGITAVAGAAVAAGSAVHVMAMQNAQLGRELRGMAEVGNTSVVEIQALSHAAREFNLEQGKTGDILKDLQDKMGDYAATGGGEMADFFENVGNAAGLTVEKLQALSGPDALIAIKQAMDQANVPMSQQVFYLESIGDEASKLIPLLAAGGAQYAKLRGEFLATNSALTDSEITRFDEYAKDVELMSGTFDALLREVVMPFVDELEEGAEYLTQMFAQGRRNLLAGKINETHTELVALREEIEAVEASGKTHGAVGEGILDRLGNAILGNTHKPTYLKEKRQEAAELEAELREMQERMAQLNGKPAGAPAGAGDGGSGFNSARLKQEQEAGAQLLASLHMQFANEAEQAELAHQERLEQVAAMQLSQQELERSGYETIAALRAELSQQSAEQRDQQLLDLEEKERASQERRLAQERAYWDRRTREWAKVQQAEVAEEAKRERARQAGINAAISHAQTSLSITTDFLQQAGKEQSTAYKVMFAMQKAAAIPSMIVSTEDAATKALAAGPYIGPILAAATRAMGYASIGIVAGQSLAGMAHSGMDYIPQEGTWLLDKGERVLSPRQNADLTKFMEGGAGGGAITVVINEAPGSNEKSVRQERGPDGRMLLFIDERVRNVVNEDASRGTGIARTLERTYGLTRQGFA